MTARVVETREAADALQSGTVVCDAGGGVALTVAGGFVGFGSAQSFDRARLALPLTVLWPLTPSPDTLRDEIATVLADAVMPIVERVRAEALEPVLALHRPTKAPGEPEVCIECHKLEYEPAHWPCRTVRAITAAREARP